MNQIDPLAALRPLHMPEPVAWWPPAPGWWLALFLMLLGILFLIWWWRRLAPQRAALHELANLQVEAGDPVHQAATVNRLLKRYALICWPGREIAALTGEPWLAFLDRHGGKGAFAQGPGRLLMVRPYCPPRQTVAASQDQASALVSLARRWIKANRPRGRQ